MKINTSAVVIACGSMILAAGCNKTADNTSNFKTAINDYYLTRPACLWSQPKQFPAQADTKDTSETTQYDALLDQGLLTRTTAEKKKMIVLSKQVTNYDLSDKGRSAWTADTQQPGFGNFCYGHWEVSSIDGSTPTSSQQGATTTVNYHAAVAGVPDWAKTAEVQNAYSRVKTSLTSPIAETATLTNFPKGWAVTTGPANGNNPPATSADGSVVQ